jgi:DNA-binding response OmpR family regulator
MPTATILFIEGKYADSPSFAPALQKKGFQIEVVSNGKEALNHLPMSDPDLVVINAASLRSTGVRICQDLRHESRSLPLVLILDASHSVDKAAADVILNLPFTPQKLINRIRPLLPSDGRNEVHVGPIRLDLEHRRVRCLGKNERLTPRLVRLLHTLMNHHGEVVERKALFKEVWETDYTGDTRTLDVHISWLRRALEVDPERPRFLKTVRGTGYRLDV